MLGATLLVCCGVGGYFVTRGVKDFGDKVQVAADKAVASNNLKDMALATHNYETGMNAFPPPTVVTTKGPNPGLSLRVALLPYLMNSQTALQQKFDLDQPWDSPRNRPHSDTIVGEYVGPGDLKAPSVMTPYRAFVGKETMFPGGAAKVGMASIQDGTSNTWLYVEAQEKVAWAQPKELLYSPTTPLPPLGRAGERTFLVAFVDGSVRNVRQGANEAVLRAYIEKADGQVTDPTILE